MYFWWVSDFGRWRNGLNGYGKHGKHTKNHNFSWENHHAIHGKITMLFMGKLTISMAMFNSFLYVYQRILNIECSHECGASLWFDLV